MSWEKSVRVLILVWFSIFIFISARAAYHLCRYAGAEAQAEYNFSVNKTSFSEHSKKHFDKRVIFIGVRIFIYIPVVACYFRWSRNEKKVRREEKRRARDVTDKMCVTARNGKRDSVDHLAGTMYK